MGGLVVQVQSSGVVVLEERVQMLEEAVMKVQLPN